MNQWDIAQPGGYRFLFTIDGFNRLVDELIRRHPDTMLRRIGIAPHSLRAVMPEQLSTAVSHIKSVASGAPRSQRNISLAGSGSRAPMP